MSEAKALVILPPKESALDVYSKPGGLDPYIQQVRDAVSGIVYDMDTAKGRDECRADAFKVARTKTAIEALGKEVSAELKQKPKLVDAERKRANEELELIQSQVRAPLDAWEAAEADRTARHKAVIANIAELASGTVGGKPISIEQRIALLGDFNVDESLQEFQAEAESVLRRARESLAIEHARWLKEKADAEELEILRAEKAERDRKEAAAALEQEAAAKARAAAENALQAERDAVRQREEEAKAAIAKAAQDLQDAADLAARIKAAAEAKAKADADAAVAAERKRVADAEEAERQEVAKREKNRAHKASVNRAAVDAFVAQGFDAESARKIVTAIAQRLIPAVTIQY